MSYKIHILDNNYTSWDIYDERNESLITLDINPLEKKILTGDVIDDKGNILRSLIRTAKYLPGILITNGKTYGRSNSNNKFYYKCIPNDKRLPAFLIPYENKNISFSKCIYNRYILFKYNNWNNKHPIGTLINNISDVTDISGFYEYQLYCKDLVQPIKQFIIDANKANKQLGQNMYDIILKNNPNIIDRRYYDIISVDPEGSTDLDDAFTINDNILSIYVANVPILLDYFKLWGSFSKRISTIYLPDRKCPMLPPLLSENLCSLIQNEERIALSIDITLDQENNITDVNINSVLIKVRKNYIYNESKLLEDTTYNKVLQRIILLNKKYKYMREISDSHHIVAYLMLLMNLKCADYLQNYKTGIYRSIALKETTNPPYENIPSDIYDYIKIWQSASGQYTNYTNNIGHQLINANSDNYIHITSPIRRLVDLLNMLKIQQCLNIIKFSNEANNFYNYWESELEYINITMRSIRKIQTDTSLLALCINNIDTLNNIYKGYMFDRIERNNKLIQYTVYIPKIKMFTRVNISEIFENFTESNFKLYLIQDGTNFKKKIRAERIV